MANTVSVALCSSLCKWDKRVQTTGEGKLNAVESAVLPESQAKRKKAEGFQACQWDGISYHTKMDTRKTIASIVHRSLAREKATQTETTGGCIKPAFR